MLEEQLVDYFIWTNWSYFSALNITSGVNVYLIFLLDLTRDPYYYFTELVEKLNKPLIAAIPTAEEPDQRNTFVDVEQKAAVEMKVC